MINAINWPIQTLAVLPAVVFILLMIAFPIIGLFAGWKRGLYWGGGTLVFYLIGLLIWRFAGTAIIAPFKEQLTEFIRQIAQSETLVITDQLLASVAAPVWFLIVMIFGELVLLINYYTWFKKKVGLKKIKVTDPKTKEVVKVYPNQAQINKGHGIVNKLGGLAALGLLTVPSTVAFTQTLYCTMTSTTTRSKNKATQDIYGFITFMNDKPFSWLSYDVNTIHNFDVIYAALTVLEIQVEDPYNPGHTADLPTVVENMIDKEMGTITSALQTIDLDPEKQTEAATAIKDSVDTIVEVWNQISSGSASAEVSALFSSPDAIDIVGQMIDLSEYHASVDKNNFEELFGEEGVVNAWVDEYVEKGSIGGGVQIAKIIPIEINEKSFNKFADFFMGFVTVTEGEGTNYEEEVSKSVKDILGLLFSYPGMPESFHD